MRRNHALALIAIALLATCGLVALFYSLYVIEETQTIAMTATASDKVSGFNVALDKLTFGTIPVGSSAWRKFYVMPERSYPVKVRVSAQGNLSPYVRFSPSEFIVSPGGNVSVEGTVRFPQGTPLGNYSGHALIRISKII